MSELSPEMENERYTAESLVDLTLGGHYCMRDEIDGAIRRIYRLWGAEGRRRMNQLPDLRAYAGEAEIDQWQEGLLQLLGEAEAADNGKADARAAHSERNQANLFE